MSATTYKSWVGRKFKDEVDRTKSQESRMIRTNANKSSTLEWLSTNINTEYDRSFLGG